MIFLRARFEKKRLDQNRRFSNFSETEDEFPQEKSSVTRNNYFCISQLNFNLKKLKAFLEFLH